MKIGGILSMIALMAALASTATADAGSGKNTWALLVGVSKYQNPMIVSLSYPAVDAASIANALTDPTLGNLPADHVLLLADDKATGSAIQSSVDSFFKPRVKAGDEIVIFLAGHGVTKGVGAGAKAYFLPSDVKGLTTQALDDSAINLRTFANELGNLPASTFVAFVDACREDPTPGRAVKPNIMTDVDNDSLQIVPKEPSKTVSSVTFFACSVGERAYEDPAYAHGVFTYWILDGIQHAAVPRKPDGAVEMGTLASYVSTNVSRWARKKSATGDFEIDQTPEVVTSSLPDPVVLMRVSRDFPDDTINPLPPKLIVAAKPPSASVSVDGQAAGTGTIEKLLDKAGKHTIIAAAPGYLPAQQEVTTFPGYAQQFTVELAPAAIGASIAPAAQDPPDLYTQARAAEVRQEYEAAEAGYAATIAQFPQFTPAYESLAEVQRRQGRIGESVATLVDLVKNAGASAHAQSLLAQAYAEYAFRGTGASASPPRDGAGPNNLVPALQGNAADLAVNAARDAVATDPGLAEAQRGLGLALIASDHAGVNRAAALKALGLAVILDHADPVNHYALGFGIRYYARRIEDSASRMSELRRAVVEQQLALNDRPNYYEAHRELAYCYHLLNDVENAQRQYELANAYRAEATDGNEVAGVNCALAVLARENADNVPSKKAQLMAASKGYWSDAKDINPDLRKPLTTLKDAGLRAQVEPYLPDNLKNTIDWSDKN
jgi:hypothetical protein